MTLTRIMSRASSLDQLAGIEASLRRIAQFLSILEIKNSKRREEISQLSNLINAAVITTDDTDYTTRRSRQDIKLNPPEETSDDEEATQISARSQARMLNAQQASRFVRIIRRRPGSRRIHQKRSLR